MHRLTKNQVMMAVGVAVSLLVTFQRPIQEAIRLGQHLETRYGLTLLPGLAVLGVVVVGHYVVTTFDRSARRQGDVQMARVLAMGQALTRVSSMSGLRNRLRRHLSEAVGAEGVWVVIRVHDRWVALAGGRPRQPHLPPADIEARCDQVGDRDSFALDPVAGTEVDGHLCFPLTIGDHGFGVVGAPSPRRGTQELRHRLASVLAVLGVSVHNVQLLTQIDERAMLDGLTGCFNRTHGMKVLDAELQRAKRTRSGVTLLLIDVDKFKAINDEYGHLCGDALLQSIGACLHQKLRNNDIKIRYGGDEFIVLLSDTPVADATQVVEMLNQSLRGLAVRWEDHQVSATVCIGASAVRAEEFDLTVDADPLFVRQSLVARADAALYRAKRAGRDRVCVDTEVPWGSTDEVLNARQQTAPRRCASASQFPAASMMTA